MFTTYEVAIKPMALSMMPRKKAVLCSISGWTLAKLVTLASDILLSLRMLKD